MSALVTAYASTATSALACRDGITRLADLYRDLNTASSREISQVMAVLESIPSPPTPGPHCGPVGSAMAKIAEQTKAVRQHLSTHVLELEFLGTEAQTLAQGVCPLADSFPLPASLPGRTVPGYSGRPYEERPCPCEKCGRPLDDMFRNCQYCESAEADIATVADDIRNGRVTVGQFETADERRHKRHAEVMAAQANADAIARLEEAEYDQLPASVFSRTAQECVTSMANGPVVEEVPPPVLMHCPGCKQETRVPVGALDAVINCPTCLLTAATTTPLAEGPAPEPEPAPAKKAPRKRRK